MSAFFIRVLNTFAFALLALIILIIKNIIFNMDIMLFILIVVLTVKCIIRTIDGNHFESKKYLYSSIFNYEVKKWFEK